MIVSLVDYFESKVFLPLVCSLGKSCDCSYFVVDLSANDVKSISLRHSQLPSDNNLTPYANVFLLYLNIFFTL